MGTTIARALAHTRDGLRWRRLAALAAFAACALTLAGCGSSKVNKDPLADVSWSYATDAVMFEIVAVPGLNEYDGQAHTLLLGVYETADAQAFRDLVANPAALATSLASGKAPTAFVQFSRYVVEPGQHSYLILDRAQNTRTVGIAAGYAQTGAGNAAHQFDIPVVTTKTGFIFKKRTMAPGPLVVKLDFGPQGIVNAQPLANGPGVADLMRARQLEGGGKEIRMGDAAAGTAAGTAGTASGPPTPLLKLGNQPD